MRLIPTLYTAFGALLFSTTEALRGTNRFGHLFVNVNSTNGPTIGHWVPSSSKDDVLEYLGIPYAQSPVGKLRFAAPERISSKTEYDAQTFGSACPQSASSAVDFPDLTPQASRILKDFSSIADEDQSEDCLTLNIWVKPTKRSVKEGKPVVVFFHGGRFSIGGSSSPFYNGRHLAGSQDIVVVTINYRLNIFGFPGTPGRVQNLGLRDQRVAVEWVKDNIKSFGGDDNKIVIAGQSSGGASVDYWLYAYEQMPIVKGVIASSGTAFSFPVNSASVTNRNWNDVVKNMGCSRNSTKAVLACMQEVDWRDIKKAAAKVKPMHSNSVLRDVPPFYPTADDEIVFGDYIERTRTHQFAKVPTLGGSNDNEAGYYRIPAYGKEVIPTKGQVDEFHLESFTCPVSNMAQIRVENSLASYVWRYFGDWPNTRLYSNSSAYHGSDLHMIFGTSEEVSGMQTTPKQRSMMRYMQKAWFEFCNDPRYGLELMGWPKYNHENETLMLLGKDKEAAPILVKPSIYDSSCTNASLAAMSAKED